MKRCFILLLLSALLAACLNSPREAANPPWVYADLRALDPADAASPSHDLVALYTRRSGAGLQIRLDLLDYSSDVDFDLYLALDTAQGGTRDLPIEAVAGHDWNVLIGVPASGEIFARDSSGEALSGLKLRVTRSPLQDSVVVYINYAGLGVKSSSVKVQALLTPASSPRLADSIGPASAAPISAGQLPKRAPVLLAFWNTFPAQTPAQALRRWDGAHSGPSSQRHGLRALLEAVEISKQPVFLLDLKAPGSLPALDYIGALPEIRKLAKQRLVNLPDPLLMLPAQPGHPFPPPGWALEYLTAANRRGADPFDLPGSPFLYAPGLWDTFPLGSGSSRHKALFTGADMASSHQGEQALISASESEDTCCYARWRDLLVMPLSLDAKPEDPTRLINSPYQAASDGPSLEVRRALVNAALAAGEHGRKPGSSPAPILLLGGSLPETTWGEARAARSTLQYFASHPWIHVLPAEDLLTAALPAAPDTPIVRPFPRAAPGGTGVRGEAASIEYVQQALLEDLRRAPAGPVTDLAWQYYQALLSPAFPQPGDLPALRAGYLGQIGHLLEAARWAADPIAYGDRSQCDQDLDWDGRPECVLASQAFFGVFEPQGGYMPFAFSAGPGGVHQLVGPSSQFVVGVSDPMDWRPELGAAGDPGQLRGAFSEIIVGQTRPSRQAYEYETAAGQLTFTAPGGGLRKTFRITSNGLEAYYRSAAEARVQIPLAVDPWRRFEPGWAGRYRSLSAPSGWSWGLEQGIRVEISTTADLTGQAFNDSSSIIRLPEDPNYEFPPGHFLPFPMALVEIQAEGDFTISLQTKIDR